MKKRIFNLFVLIVSLALLSSASGAAAQKPTQSTPYQTWDGKEDGAVQQQVGKVRLVGLYDTPGGAENVAVAGNYAYVADGTSGLRIIDISDPTNPSEVSFYEDPSWFASDVSVDGNYAYIAGIDGLYIINISDPANPSEAGFYQPPWYTIGLAVSGNYAYITDGGDSGLRIIDVSDPTNPTETGFYDTPGSAYDVAVSGNYAYVVDGGSGLRIIDVSNPTAPTETGFYDTPGFAKGVTLSGNYAYVADGGSGLRIIDVSNPTAPIETGFYDTPGEAKGVAFSENFIYVADGGSIEGGDLHIIDVSDPTTPIKAGFYDTPGRAFGVVVYGNDAYVADSEGGLVILRFFPYQVHLPCIARACLPLFIDNFGDPSSGWPVGDDGNIRYEYLNDEYRILVRNTNLWAGARPGFQASDYILATDVRNFDGGFGSYGLIFGISSDWSQFYTFEIDSQGYYGIYRYDSGAWTLVTSDWSSIINRAALMNRLKIKRDGNLIEAYANGELLASISDGYYTGMRYMGLYIGTFETNNLDVRFDNFVVYPANCNIDVAQIGETFQATTLESLDSIEQWQIFSQPQSRKR